MIGPEGAERPLQANIEGEELVIRVGVKMLAVTAGLIETPGDPNYKPLFKVVDTAEFVKDVASELQREEDDGSSPLTELLDAACLAAWENGSLGCEE